MEAVHLFKSPGSFRKDGMTYDICSVSSKAQLEEKKEQGWCITLQDAIEAAGVKGLVIPKKVDKKLELFKKKMRGNLVKPVEPWVEPEEPKEEAEPAILDDEDDNIPDYGYQSQEEAEEVKMAKQFDEAQKRSEKSSETISSSENESEQVTAKFDGPEDKKPKGVRKYEELSDGEKLEILELLRAGELKDIEIAKLYSIHHFTLKTFKKELEG